MVAGSSTDGNAASPSRLPKMPAEIKSMLENEPQWDFDIISFEAITKKRYTLMSFYCQYRVMCHLAGHNKPTVIPKKNLFLHIFINTNGQTTP